MTFEEAKKILEKEGFYVEKATRPCPISESFIEYEDPTICEAMQIVCSAGYFISMEMSRFNERKARLKEKYGNNHIKGDFSKNKSIEHCGEPGSGEEQPEDKSSSVPHAGLVYDQNFEVERLRQENKDLLKVVERMKKGNPALKEAASQFNDALLDEQAKKIKRLGKEIAKLNSIIHDKNAVLAAVAEELRFTKIREKNLAELGLKYVGENEKLKKELADKVVDKIDAQALKSAESALAYKDKVIADLTKKLNVKHKKYVYYNGTIVAVQRLVNTLAGYAAKRYYKELCDQMVDIAEEGADLSGVFVLCGKDFIDALKKAEDADIWQE
jgi:predicted RNase H-like nuclease (RuvC/YqgF family)